MTVNDLVRNLRLRNALLKGVIGMKGVTVMTFIGKNRYGAGETLLEDGEMADKKLIDLGWGEDCDTVWLAVKTMRYECRRIG